MTAGSSRELPHVPLGGKEASRGPKISRRGFLGMMATAAAAGVGGKSALDNIRSTSRASSGEGESVNNSATKPEVETSVGMLVVPELPDRFTERPWADPEQLIGLTPEQLRDIAAVPVDEYTRTDEGFVDIFHQKIELIANAGLTAKDVVRARENGYPVGEINSNGGYKRGIHRDYVEKFYMNDMMDGLFNEKYNDPKYAGADEHLKRLLLGLSVDYEYALTDESRYNTGVTRIDLNSFEPLLSSGEYERNLYVTLNAWLPGVGDETKRRNEYQVDVVVNASEGSDGLFRLAIQYANTDNS